MPLGAPVPSAAGEAGDGYNEGGNERNFSSADVRITARLGEAITD